MTKMSKFRWDRLMEVVFGVLLIPFIFVALPLFIGWIEVSVFKWNWFTPTAMYWQGLVSALALLFLALIGYAWRGMLQSIICWFFEEG